MESKLTYKDAGVDTKEGERAVNLMKEEVKKTFNKNVLTGLGSFGSLYQLELEDMKTPVLVSGTDGVGTKLKLAFDMDKHDTIGQDCVAMCVNDILCQGARPLFFLDYIATAKVEAEKIAAIVKGIAEACIIAECALVGGETAEMPGFYQTNEYDLAGFAVGIVDKSKIINGERIKSGDIVIGLPSSGLHSNGFSLARKVLFEKMGYNIKDKIKDFDMTLGETLLAPTHLYTKECKAVFDGNNVLGIAHITGGGFFENIPRIIPEGLGVEIDKSKFSVPSIFELIKKSGNIDENEMFATFNMGIGMIMVVKEEEAEQVMRKLTKVNNQVSIIGKIVRGNGVQLCQK
jgi:phosphoribosylformylglycinamidine cyclo-ligase